MLEFVIAGLVLGGIFAIASAGLVITYTASGILNFAFGAMAFFIARFYYFLHTEYEPGDHIFEHPAPPCSAAAQSDSVLPCAALCAVPRSAAGTAVRTFGQVKHTK